MVALIQYGHVLVEGNMGHKDTCIGPQHMQMETEIRLTSTSQGVAGAWEVLFLLMLELPDVLI